MSNPRTTPDDQGTPSLSPSLWRVVRLSKNTGRVLKVVARDLRSHREATLWLEGYLSDHRVTFSRVVTHVVAPQPDATRETSDTSDEGRDVEYLDGPVLQSRSQRDVRQS